MNYDIKIRYQTGNSFNTYEEESLLDFPVNDINIAKFNLQRIKDHYDIFQKARKYSPLDEEFIPPDWYLTYSIPLKINETEYHNIGVFWIGYFEQLDSATIVMIDDNDMTFTVN